MTKTMIKKEFFAEGSYQFETKSQDDNPSLEFCLPFAELKHVVEGLDPESSILQLEYPVNDNKLQICIPEEAKAGQDSLQVQTIIHMDTYEVNHTLNVENTFK